MKRNFTAEQYALVIALLAVFVWISLPILRAVSLGLFLSMVLNPVYQKLLRKKQMPPALSAGALTGFMIFCVLLPIIYIGVIVAKDAANLAQNLANQASNMHTVTSDNFLSSISQRVMDYIPASFEFSQKELLENIGSIFSMLGTQIAKGLGELAKSLPDTLLDIFFLIIALFYGLIDGQRISKFVQNILPFARNEISTLAQTTRDIIHGVVIGSLVAGLVQGSIITFSFLIFGVPRPIFFGVMTLVFSFIPMLGAAPAGIGATIYLIIQGRPIAAIMMFGLFLLAGISDNLVKPLALKGRSEMHPLIAFIAIIGGLSTFGFSGIFLGPLIAALAIVALNILQKNTPMSASGSS